MELPGVGRSPPGFGADLASAFAWDFCGAFGAGFDAPGFGPGLAAEAAGFWEASAFAVGAASFGADFAAPDLAAAGFGAPGFGADAAAPGFAEVLAAGFAALSAAAALAG